MSEAATGAVTVSPIHKKLGLVKKAVGAIGKDRRGQGINYSFRGIDDIYEAAHFPLIENGVRVYPQIVPGTLTREVKELQTKDGRVRLQSQLTCVLRVEFIDEDTGTGVAATVVAEGYDDSDKASGKLLSYGMKTAIAHVLQIPSAVEEPDAERPDTSQDPEAVITAFVKKTLTVGTVEDLERAYKALPKSVAGHKDVIGAAKAAKERLS
jgi:hypothetical protein